jgi:eukaryotic-like serine/threonine-protein kinase
MFDTTQSEYVQLRSLVKGSQPRLVIWVGSGLSTPVGHPTWVQLIDKLITRLKTDRDRLPQARHRDVDAAIRFAETHQQPWLAMQSIHDAIGRDTFCSWIYTILTEQRDVDVPKDYTALWKLRPKGIITPNLDRLVADAFPLAMPRRRLPTEFVGKDAASHLHLLTSPNPWIAHIHGLLANRDSWVMTRDELTRLWESPEYVKFIEQVMISNTVLFVGVSAEDVSAGGHLRRLREKQYNFGEHFWLTHRSDESAKQFALDAGVRMLLYGNATGDHRGLSMCLADLEQYVPQEPILTPITPNAETSEIVEELGEPEALDYRYPDLLRQQLNREARRILAGKDQASYDKYAEFRKKYQRAIHAAWFVSEVHPENRVLGYEIKRHIARGAFGDVYEAEDGRGAKAALKIFREDQSRVAGMLESFRRGVRAMLILSEKEISGMVPYQFASEIPPIVAMDFVDGHNLREAKNAQMLEDWLELLRIGVELCSIIYDAHTKADVLHRDLRPANIMLRRREDGLAREVVVLDFDLSWHRDAIEASIDTAEAQSGYLAPELLPRSRPVGSNTRNPLVDSYGLGMTLLYMRTGIDPVFLEHRHADWSDRISKLCEGFKCGTWLSLARRYSRVIHGCTLDSQGRRPTIAEVQSELQRLMQALNAPREVRHADMLAEELAVRASSSGVIWNEEKAMATIPLQQGASLSLLGNEATGEVVLKLNSQDTGSAERQRRGSWMKQRMETVRSRLKSDSWRLLHESLGSGEFSLSASAQCKDVRLNLQKYAGLVESCTNAVGS